MADSDKQLKKEQQKQLADAQSALSAGNFRRAKAILQRLVPHESRAAALLESLRIDRAALYVGLGVMVVYVAAWIVSLKYGH